MCDVFISQAFSAPIFRIARAMAGSEARHTKTRLPKGQRRVPGVQLEGVVRKPGKPARRKPCGGAGSPLGRRGHEFKQVSCEATALGGEAGAEDLFHAALQPCVAPFAWR